MSLFVLGDVHLALGVPEKRMDVFSGWRGYLPRLEANWKSKIRAKDTVVLAGDISWGMTLAQARADFAFLDALPGEKVLLKGNHDYWWTSLKKMTSFFEACGFATLHPLQNACFRYGATGICGTRGWLYPPEDAQDEHLLAREAGRLRLSLEAARHEELAPVVFLHYPPIAPQGVWSQAESLFRGYGVRRCFYGHLHGRAGEMAVQGVHGGVDYRLISSDYLHFSPYKVE